MSKVFKMSFAKIYQLYIDKVTRKGRTQAELDQVIFWLSGHTEQSLCEVLDTEMTVEEFFSSFPAPHPNTNLIKGVVCGIRVEDITDPLIKNMRNLDKLVDELAKGKAMEKILRK